MKKHTPGPWVILQGTYENGTQLKIVPKDINWSTYILVGGGRGPKTDTHSDVTARRQNNARLISAAPDLLEVCLEIANDPKCDLVNSDRRMRLYGVIKKAVGSV